MSSDHVEFAQIMQFQYVFCSHAKCFSLLMLQVSECLCNLDFWVFNNLLVQTIVLAVV